MQSKTTHKQKQGFSLVELLVVMAIIAILMGIVIGVSGSIQRNAAEAKAKAEIAGLMTEIELYKADNGQYPPSGNVSGREVMMLNKASTADPSDPEGFMDWYEDKYPDTVFTMINIATSNGTDYFIDPWGKAIIYEYDESTPFIYLIGSTGTNGALGGNGSSTFGDGDDITSRNGAL
ncbi:type II secretion system protein [Kiritimatiellaeota bacterium B1221]|nr:type II secretion system protein [Kiritimatiellaeota bacterium B1221]